MKHLTIAIDFDGTIADTKWPDIHGAIPGAIEAIRFLKKQGHTIIINTCRTGKPGDDALAWLVQHNVPFDHFNANSPERNKAFGGDTRKISADVYIDDKNIFCPAIDARYWARVKREVVRLSG